MLMMRVLESIGRLRRLVSEIGIGCCTRLCRERIVRDFCLRV
jgi:hypothetical protein